MLYKVSILAALLSIGSLGKEDGSRRLLDGYTPSYTAGYSAGNVYNGGSYGTGSTYGGGSYGGSTYGTGSSYGGSYSSVPNFDGTYSFTCLGETFFVNVCGSRGAGYGSYGGGSYGVYSNKNDDVAISFNAQGTDARFSNYVFGVFRSSTGVVSRGSNVFELSFEGFQFEMPSGISYDTDLSYSIILSNGEYILVRDEDSEEFSLKRISNIALQECMEPGQSYFNIPPGPYPATFKSEDLIDTGMCSEAGISCFELGIIDMVPFGTEGTSCFAVFDEMNPDEAITGGIHIPNSAQGGPDTFFDGNILLASFVQEQFRSENAACRLGAAFYGLDRNDPNIIIISFRCSEGNGGFTHRLTRTDRMDVCPLFIPREPHKRRYRSDRSD